MIPASLVAREWCLHQQVQGISRDIVGSTVARVTGNRIVELVSIHVLRIKIVLFIVARVVALVAVAAS